MKTFEPRVRLGLICILVSSAPLAGCGGGGGGGGDGTPSAQIGFPAGPAATDTQTLTVTGEAERGSAPVEGVRVNGVEATSSDGFATWSAEVPLVLGTNRIEVEVEDEDGNVFPDSARVDVARRAQVLADVRGLVHVPQTDELFLLDAGNRSLLRVPDGKGLAVIVSDDDHGAGDDFLVPFELAVTADGSRAFVYDAVVAGGLFEVATSTGNRRRLALGPLPLVTSLVHDPLRKVLYAAGGPDVLRIDPALETVEVLSDGSEPKLGPTFTTTRGLALEESTGRLYLTDGEESVLAVDLAKGERVLVTGGDVGKGTDLVFATEICVDPATGLLHVLDASFNRILLVDPATGIREVELELAPLGLSPTSLAFDSERGLVLIGDARTDVVFALDSAVPELSAFVEARVGSGEPLTDLRALDFADSKLWAGGGMRGVLEIDLRNGARTLIPLAIPDETLLLNARDVEVDADNGRAFLVDDLKEALIELDLATGVHREIEDATGSHTFSNPFALALVSSDRVVVGDSGTTTLFTVDLATEVFEVLSADGDGKGDELKGIADVCFDPARARVLVSTGFSSRITAVDLVSGERTILSEGSIGGGAAVGIGGSLALDPAGDRLLVADPALDQIVAVDLETGFRTLVSGANVGRGPALDELRGLAFDERSGQILTFLPMHGAIAGLDVGSGDRVVVAK